MQIILQCINDKIYCIDFGKPKTLKTPNVSNMFNEKLVLSKKEKPIKISKVLGWIFNISE